MALSLNSKKSEITQRTQVRNLIRVKLSDVSTDGTSALVTKDVLNATRRNSFEKPEAMIPGRSNALLSLGLGLRIVNASFT